MRERSWIPLLLLVPVPSLGVLAGMVLWPDSFSGTFLFGVCKVWLLLFPLLWHLKIDGQRVGWSPPRRGGFGIGLLSGGIISGVIFASWLFAGPRLIDTGLLQEQIAAVGLDSPQRYFLGAVYWILVNAILEEYVWRWFVVSKCLGCFGRRTGPAWAAFFFTLHHVIALSVIMDGLPVLLCSAGVFIGGLVWSAMYARFQSIWPGYLSHAIVDLCIFGIGGWILFAN